MTAKDFFIYGSLCHDFVHFNKIQSLVQSHQVAHIAGSCYRTPVGFPVVLDQGQDLVPGDLVSLSLSPVMEAFLDEWQGHNPMDPDRSLTQKKIISVSLQNGDSIMATSYFLNPLKKTTQLIKVEGGNWREDLKQNPPLPERLNERQRTYVVKLGACAGRDIIPIDLVLYRELMNLELIVDKGRRLALSKLGQEVYRYLCS